MARTKKEKTTAEKIQEVEAQIASKKAELADLENTLAALKEEKKQEDLLVLYNQIQESGLTIDQALELLKQFIRLSEETQEVFFYGIMCGIDTLLCSVM